MIRILFLDFDGVLNSAAWNRRRPPRPEGMEGIAMRRDEYAHRNLDPDAIARLSRIVDETGCRVVVSSAWRAMHPITELNGYLRRYGGFRHTLFGATPDGWDAADDGPLYAIPQHLGTRGKEIAVWLAMLPASLPRSYVILDDEFVGEHDGRLVQTDYNHGLTDADAERAIGILKRPCAIAATEAA